MDPNPRMLTLLRESRGLTVRSLAERSGIPAGTLSKVENSLSPFTTERLTALSSALHYPPAAFTWTDRVYGFGSASFYHRKQQSLPQSVLRKVQANVNLMRMRLSRLVAGLDVEAMFAVPTFDVEELGSAAEVARAVRSVWMLPLGRIENIVTILERAGILVVRADLESPKISAISNQAVDSLPPMIVLNSQLLPDRERFTLAHELGHLVMHGGGDLPTDGEREADEFAAEFLMPAAEIRHQLDAIDLERAFQLKTVWRCSAAAIIYRAHQLGRIDDARYKSLSIRRSQKGWRKIEPQTFDQDPVFVVPAMVQVHLEELGYSVDDLSNSVGLYTDDFVALFNPKIPARRPTLRAV